MCCDYAHEDLKHLHLLSISWHKVLELLQPITVMTWMSCEL